MNAAPVPVLSLFLPFAFIILASHGGSAVLLVVKRQLETEDMKSNTAWTFK
jgi:hypothetical protein